LTSCNKHILFAIVIDMLTFEEAFANVPVLELAAPSPPLTFTEDEHCSSDEESDNNQNMSTTVVTLLQNLIILWASLRPDIIWYSAMGVHSLCNLANSTLKKRKEAMKNLECFLYSIRSF
jgi:hypothetical protein